MGERKLDSISELKLKPVLLQRLVWIEFIFFWERKQASKTTQEGGEFKGSDKMMRSDSLSGCNFYLCKVHLISSKVGTNLLTYTLPSFVPSQLVRTYTRDYLPCGFIMMQITSKRKLVYLFAQAMSYRRENQQF